MPYISPIAAPRGMEANVTELAATLLVTGGIAVGALLTHLTTDTVEALAAEQSGRDTICTQVRGRDWSCRDVPHVRWGAQ